MKTYDSGKTATQARQGDRRLDNFWVLIVGVLSVVALFAIIFLVFFFNTPASVPNP